MNEEILKLNQKIEHYDKYRHICPLMSENSIRICKKQILELKEKEWVKKDNVKPVKIHL